MGLCLVTIQTAFRNNSTKNYDKYTYVKPPNVLCLEYLDQNWPRV